MNAIPSNPAAHEGRQAWPALLALAAQEVFAVMLDSRLAVASESPASEEADVTAMVGLAGQVSGLVTVRCTTAAATLMVSRMLGLAAEQAGPETWDAVGEVCNMIAGNFKNRVTGMGDGCALSPPTVLTGSDYRLHSLTGSAEFKTKLRFEGFPLIVSLEVWD